jgi:hypothetical protein
MNGRQSGLQAGTAIDHAHRGSIRTSSKSPARRKPSPRNVPAQLVEAFLQYALADGAVSVAKLEEKARGAELIGERQTITDSKRFRAAKAALHIRSYRVGFGPGAVWFWALPAPPSAPMPEILSSPASIAPASDACAGGLSPRDIPASTEALRAYAEVATDDASTRRVPFDWVRGVELIQLRPRPLGIPGHRWRIFIEDCRRFVASQWAERAVELGWDTPSLFGSRFQPPHEHLGSSGLLWNLAGGEILRLHRDGATIRAKDEQRSFRRRPGWMASSLPWDSVEP